MPSYMIDIKLSCDGMGCTMRPVVEVFNRFNESRGRFCRKCGARKLRELQFCEGSLPGAQ